jgi:GDP-4-dehydro-6-deoxy-D-mannose reductase
LPVDEAHPLQPLDPYGISKAAADQYCAFMYAAAGLDVVRLRPFNHSGPGQPPEYALPAFARQIVQAERGETEPVVRVGNLDARRDFLHVGDVVRAYECAALQGRAGEVYNVCSGSAFALHEALDRLIALAKCEVRVETDPERLRPTDVPEIRGSHERLTADTGWRPEISFDALLEDLLRWWRQQPRTKPGA